MNKDNLFFKSVVVLIFVGIALFSLPAFKEISRKNKIKAEIENLRKEREELEKNNYFRRERNAYFETKEYKERVSKERLNLQKKGERVVLIKHGPESLSDGSNEDFEKESIDEQVLGEKDKSNTPNYRKWWNYFFEY